MSTVTDLFAGAGGSSTGAVAAGAEVLIAANHWRLAVDTHAENHPSTDHDCADISQVDPRRYPATDILWASPECTHHSNASGQRRDGDFRPPSLFDQDRPLPTEAYERSRATMWDVPRFAEHHRYPIVLIENVVEATKWAPFRAWLMSMESLGYRHEIICHNSMHAQMGGLPAPQSRDRLYVAFWDRRMRRPDWDRVQTAQAWCPRCETSGDAVKAWKREGNRIGKYRAQYIYVCAKCGHDVEPGWLPAASAIDWTIPAQRIGDRKRPLAEKTMARIRAGLEQWHDRAMTLEVGGNAYDTADPRHPQYGTPGGYMRIWPTNEPLKTVHATASKALLVPAGGTWSDTTYPTDDALRTVTTRETTGLLMPYYGASTTAEPTDMPMGTVTTVDRYGLIVPMRNHGRTHSTTEPLGTIAAGGLHHGLIPQPSIDPDDCGFRMLEPREYAAGMAFPRSYVWRGTKRERVKMAGNAVTPPMARDLITAASEALEAVA